MPSPRWGISFSKAFTSTQNRYEMGFEHAIVACSLSAVGASGLVEDIDRQSNMLAAFIDSLKFFAKSGKDPNTLPAAKDFIPTEIFARRLLEAEIPGFYHFQGPDWHAYIARDDRDPQHPKGIFVLLHSDKNKPLDLKGALEEVEQT